MLKNSKSLPFDTMQVLSLKNVETNPTWELETRLKVAMIAINTIMLYKSIEGNFMAPKKEEKRRLIE